MTPIRVLVVGCGNMGSSHARAYHSIPGFQIVGLCSRLDDRLRLAEQLGGDIPTFTDFDEALRATKPDAVSINTYPDTHAALVRQSLQAGTHVFVEKPLATTVAEAQQLVDLALQSNKKMMVGYILRVHPAWQRFIELAKTLGKPLVMRMNLNQQSRGKEWQTHQNLMKSMSPIVDCGVHYVDVMCQMTGSRPIRVSAIGARLSDEIAATQHNYGMLQVAFADGSVGWYEAGWGPMMSEVAYFVKDVVGPKGCVSITDKAGERKTESSNIDSHSKTNSLRLHHAERNADGAFAKADEWIDTTDEPDHDGLCKREQEAFLRAIRDNVDLTQHLRDAVDSLRIVLAADESARSGKTIAL